MKEIDVIHYGVVVGKAQVNEDGLIVSAELSAEGVKEILPGYEISSEISIADVSKSVIPFLHTVDGLDEAHFIFKKQKGTFDA
jgi:hypothetical protein